MRQSPPPQPGRPHLTVVMSPAEPANSSPAENFDALLLAVAQGERAAFATLFTHFAPRLKTWLMRSGSSDTQAEELAQEALVKVWRKAAQFDPAQAGASTWIFTIARNLRVDLLRRQGLPTQELDEAALAELPDLAPPPDEALHAQRRERRVRAAMVQLTAEQAQVIQLSYFDDQPHARIAEMLGIPLGTVKSRIRLALNHLRRLIDGAEAP
ncbi:sigma-70 family RNA polymerase sigma factor [Paucibacter sp. JuS9]